MTARATATLAAALLIAACREGAPTPQPSATAAAPAAPAQAAPRGMAATGDRLSADVSPLIGTITGFSTRESDLGTIVALDADVLFDFDRAVLRPDATPALARAADLVRGGGAAPVAIVGYTDAKGDDAYNLALSRRRADAVAGWLRARPDVGRHAYTVAGMGERDPVAPNARPDGTDDPAGRAKNRRVEIVIPH